MRADRPAPGLRRLIVHPGVQKTGSTAVQRHLRRNEAALSRHLVLRTPEERSAMRPLGRAAIAFSLAPCAPAEAGLRQAFRAVLDGLPPNGLPVLLSHENLAGAMPGNGGETRLYPALPVIAAILKDEARGFASEFVLYTRAQAAWRVSVWAQAVRTDGYRRDLAAFEAETAGLPGWDDLFDRMAATTGATRLRLEDETDRARPGRQLLRHAGLSDAVIDGLAPLDGGANPRLNDNATEFLRRLNGLSLNPHAHGRVVDLVARARHLFAADAPRDDTP